MPIAPKHRRTRHLARAAAPMLYALLLAALLALAGCAGSSSSSQRSAQGLQPCPVNNLKVPCMVGPDGKLYRLDRPAENGNS